GQVKKWIGNKDLSTFFQLRLNTWIFRNLPLWLSRLYLGIIGAGYFLLAGKERRRIKKALSNFQEGQSKKVNWRQIRAGIFDHYHEKLFLGFKPFGHIRRRLLNGVQIKGLDILHKALSQGRGVILATGHFGAVEFLPGALSFRNLPVTAMVHCKSKSLAQTIRTRAERAGVMLMDPKSEAVFFSALRHLAKGRILITQCDEIDMWRPYKKRHISFLGHRAGLDRSLDVLAGKSKAPVVFGLLHRRPWGRFEMVLQELPDRTGARNQSLVSAQCLAFLDQAVKITPQAWYEWKKLSQFEPLAKNTPDEIIETGRLPDQMALSAAGGA
ncbi:MAG: lysophospholipid acyltransferase family protein, partial [Desulfarculaceae bacterium]